MSINLENNIKLDLWNAISSNYESGHYKDAILDAMHYLSDILRGKTGLDNDGIELAGAALGGNSPVLRINKLQTDTEKNIQKGVHHLIMGMYGAIRNPRSHEQMQDSREDADAIIYFINYILKVLDASEEPFTIDGFLERIYDLYFVETEKYAELLISEIPKSKRLDTLIEINRNKSKISSPRLEVVVHEILKSLSDNQLEQFLTVISDELKTTTDNIELIKILRMLHPELWSRINEAVRLRIESMLIKAIAEGRINDAGTTTTITASLGTWAASYLKHFLLKKDVAQTLINKLASEDKYEQGYVLTYFRYTFVDVITTPAAILNCVNALCKLINDGDEYADSYVKYQTFPEEWKIKLQAKLGEDYWSTSSVDDIPF